MTAAPTQTPPRAALLDRLALAWALAVSLALFAFFHGWGFDDPFITYRYAANLAGGAGFVYNPGERVLSTTAPFYALLLVPAAALGLNLPLVSNLIGCASLGLGGLALWRLGRAARQPVAGAVGLATYPLVWILILALGAETAPFIALTLWGFVALTAGRPALAGLVLAVATLVRADAALAAAIAGLALLLRGELRPLLRMSLAYLFMVAPFVLAAWAYFGSPLPATFGAKRSQGQIPDSRSYLSGLGLQITGLFGQPLLWPLLGMAPLGVGAASRRPSPLVLPLAWGALQALAYSLLGVNAYFWYYGPALLALVVAAALGAQFLADTLRPRRAPWAGAALAAALVVSVVAGEVVALGRATATRDLRLPLYREIGLWLRANTPPDARVGMLEVGVIGYYAERPVVDFAGLIQPEVADQFAAGGRFDQAAQWAVERYQPEYIVSQESALPLVSADAELARRCAAIARFHDPRAPTPVTVYRCDWGGP